MSFEGKNKKSEQADSQENKSERELSLSEIDELLKKSEKVSDNLDKFSKDEFYKKENFEDLRVAVDKPDDRFDEEVYAKAGFWKKFKNFTRFGFQKERYNLVKSEYGGLLDKTKIDEDIIGRGIEIRQNNKQEKEYLEQNVVDIRGDFKKDNFERSTAKSFELVDGKIIKYVASSRTEKGQVEAAGRKREAEIGRLETVNGAELVGLKESLRKNAESRKNISNMMGVMSEGEKEKITTKLNEEENLTKEKIKEKEEKIAEELSIFKEPLEGRLKETMEMENILANGLDFIKTEESKLNKQIKEYEDYIKQAQKERPNLLADAGGYIIKILEEKKVIADAQAKDFAERKALVSSKLEVLKTNKKEIEATLSRVNNIGKTKQEIVDKEKSKKETKAETKPTEEKKDDKEKKKTWDETRDEVWGVNNTQETAPSAKKGGKKIDIGELFEHYGSVPEKNEEEESEKKVKTKKVKKVSSKRKIKKTKGEETANEEGDAKGKKDRANDQIDAPEKFDVVEDGQIAEKKFTDEEIEKIVMKELKTVGFMNNKKVSEKSKDGLTKHLIGAVKNEILKSPEKVTEKFIKNEVDDWYKRLTKNLNESGK